MKKKYKIRKGSLAWHWNEILLCFRKNRKAIIIVTVITACMAAVAWAGEEKEPQQVNHQVTYEICSQSEYEPIPVLADVPLDKDLQTHIWETAEDYNLEPELVLAVIGQESNFKSQKVGDDGKSKGLMQVQEKWHEERMKRLECTSLFDPYENVTVGVDYLAECIEKGGLEWGLMAYNGGAAYANEKTKQGVVTEYVEGVLTLYEFYKDGEF